MQYVEIGLLVAGLVLLIVGHRKNRRNVLLVAAVLLLMVGTVGDFAQSFTQGVVDGWVSVQAAAVK